MIATEKEKDMQLHIQIDADLEMNKDTTKDTGKMVEAAVVKGFVMLKGEC